MSKFPKYLESNSLSSVSSVTILYPLCPSHSGSTLLSLLIGSQEKICGVGELFMFSNRFAHQPDKKEGICNCNNKGKKYCPFWQEVENYLIQYGLSLDEIDVESENSDVLRTHNHYLFQALTSVSKSSFIIDSSKSIKRFVQLRKAGFRVIPILFKRNSAAVVYSWTKRGYDWQEVACYYADYYQEVAQSIPDRQNLSVSYESLTQNPKPFLSKLLKYLKLDASTIEQDWTLNQTHYLRGNAVRFSKQAILRPPSNSWKSELTIRQKFIIAVMSLSCWIDNYRFYLIWAKITRMLFIEKKVLKQMSKASR